MGTNGINSSAVLSSAVVCKGAVPVRAIKPRICKSFTGKLGQRGSGGG